MRRGVIVVLALALGATSCSNSSEPATARTPATTTTAKTSTTTTVARTTTSHAASTTSTSTAATTSTTSPPPAPPLAVPSADRGTWDSWSKTNRVNRRGLAVAPDGDIWALTSGGLVHWDTDGSYIEINDPSWPDPAPWSIAFTPDGDLWLGFYVDVIQMTPTGDVRHEFTPEGESWGGVELAEGPDGNIWAAAGQFGVHRFDGAEWHRVVTDLPGRGDLDTFAVDASGRPWVGSYWSGLWVIEDGELRQETSRTTRVVRAGPDGDVWYKVDSGHGEDVVVVHVDGATGNRTEYALDPINVWDIAPIDGAAYIGTNPLADADGETHGLWLLQDGQVTAVPGSWDAPQRQVLAVEVDDAGSVWLGGQMGVWRYDGKNEQQYLTDTFNSFRVGFISTGEGAPLWSGDCDRSSVFANERWHALPATPEGLYGCDTVIDSNGRFWIAGDEGIARLDEDQWVVHHRDAAFLLWRDLYLPCDSEACDEPHWSMAAGTDVWAGMIGVEDTLWRYEGDAWRRMPAGLPEGAGPISAITTAPDGTLWVAARNGVYHLEEGGWVSYSSGEVGPPANVQAIAVGGGKAWARSYQEIAKFDGDTWTSYPLPDGSWDPRILLVDSEGSVWLPSPTGAQRFDGASFTHLDIPGTDSAYMQAMAIDAAGAWWMTAGNRLYRWKP